MVKGRFNPVAKIVNSGVIPNKEVLVEILTLKRQGDGVRVTMQSAALVTLWQMQELVTRAEFESFTNSIHLYPRKVNHVAGLVTNEWDTANYPIPRS